MRTASWSLALVAGAGSVLAQSPGGYGESSSEAAPVTTSASSASSYYGTGVSSSAVAPVSTGSGFPSCWYECFKEANVTSEASACDNSEVTSCIKSTCSSADSSAYTAWLSKYCSSSSSATYPISSASSSSSIASSGASLSVSSSVVAPISTGVASISTGVVPRPSGSAYPSGGFPVPSGSGSGTVPYPTGSAPYPRTSCTSTYTSVCTETSTLIYRTTTALTCTTITHTLTTSFAGACSVGPTGFPSGSSSSPAGAGSASSSPAGGESVSSSPVSPVSSSIPVGPGSVSSYPGGGESVSSAPVSPVSSSVPAGAGSSASGYTTIVTGYTTVYTTTCPVTETQTTGSETSTSTYETTSIVTSVIPTTITVSPAGGSPTGYPTIPGSYGGSSPSGTSVAAASTGGSPAGPGSYGGSSPSSAGGSPAGSGSYGGSSPSSAGGSPAGPGSYGGSATSGASVAAATTGGSPAGPGSYGGTSPSSPAGGSPVGPGSYGGSSPSAGSPAGPGGYGTHTPGEVYTTETVTQYTTECPVEKSFTYGPWTSLYTDTEISTLTKTIQTTITVPTSSGLSPVGPTTTGGPGGYPGGPSTTEVITTEITTIYTTVCPVTETETGGESTSAESTAAYSTSAESSGVYSTSSESEGAYSTSASTLYTTSTVTSSYLTTYTTTVPVGPTGVSSYPVGGSTSVCTETSTFIYRNTTSLSTYTVTHTITPSGGFPSGSSPIGPIGTGTGGGYPSGYPHSIGSSSSPVGATGTGGGYPSGYSHSSGSSSSPVGATGTGGGYPSGYSHSSGSSSSPVGATGTGGGYPSGYSHSSGSSSSPVGATGTGGGYPSGYPHGSGSSSSPVGATGTGGGYPSGYPHGSGSSSSPVGATGTGGGYPSGYPHSSGSSSSPVGATGTGGYPHSSGTAPVSPVGTGASSGFPYPSGTAASSSSSSTSSSCTTKPTSTELCKPCDGQPSDNPEEFCGLDINTNWYQETPKTCKTVEYTWEVTQTEMAPDGFLRMVHAVNGQFPGPLIEANWGDTIVIHMTNGFTDDIKNGTSVHMHGMRQHGTPEFDGVPSLSQCPIAPGKTMTYTFTATNYGSSWWHSHFGLQAYEGVYGPVIIHGPDSYNGTYDEEQFISLQDWSHATSNELYAAAQVVTGTGPGEAPTLDNGLINGHNTFPGLSGGERWSMDVVAGSKYRLRVLNAAIASTFKFYVDGHSFTVIQSDFVPITPYETTILNINPGQRYDLILEANQPIDNYWMRSDNQAICNNVTNGEDIKAIVHYVGAPVADPTSTAYEYQPECVDESLSNLVPIVAWNAGSFNQEIVENVVIQPNGQTPNLYKWFLSGNQGASNTFQAQWGNPTLYSIEQNGTIPSDSGDLAIQAPNLGEWVYVIVESPIPLPHPIHLHGHDFLILAQGTGLWNSGVALNLENPPRRDTAIMPFDIEQGFGGFLVIGFYTDNPGVWLLHCHIGWHISMGFALQIIENLEGINDTISDSCQTKDICDAWHAYAALDNVYPFDAGV